MNIAVKNKYKGKTLRHGKCYLGGETKKNVMVGHVMCVWGERRGSYRVLVGRPDGKRSFGRPERRLEENIRMDLQEVGWWVMDWIDLS